MYLHICTYSGIIGGSCFLCGSNQAWCLLTLSHGYPMHEGWLCVYLLLGGSGYVEYIQATFLTQTQATTLKVTWANGLLLPRMKASLESNVLSGESIFLLCWKFCLQRDKMPINLLCSYATNTLKLSSCNTTAHVHNTATKLICITCALQTSSWNRLPFDCNRILVVSCKVSLFLWWLSVAYSTCAGLWIQSRVIQWFYMNVTSVVQGQGS